MINRLIVLSFLIVCCCSSVSFATDIKIGDLSRFIGPSGKFQVVVSGGSASPVSYVDSLTTVIGSGVYKLGYYLYIPVASSPFGFKFKLLPVSGYTVLYVVDTCASSGIVKNVYADASGYYSFSVNFAADGLHTICPYAVVVSSAYVYGSAPVSMYGSVPFEPLKVSSTAPDEMNYFNSLVFYVASFCFVPAVCARLFAKG